MTLCACTACRFRFTSHNGYICPKCGCDDVAEGIDQADLDREMARIERIWPTKITARPVSTFNLEQQARAMILRLSRDEVAS